MKKLKWNRFYTILVLLMFITVTFASFNTNLFINGDAYLRVSKDIRITNIRLLESEYNGYENTNSEYTVDSVSMDVSLPRQASSVTYEVTISNVSDKRYKITDILESSYNNKNVKYELVDASIGNIVEPHTEKTFTIKFTNNVTVVEEDDVYETKEYTFDYTGSEQVFTVPYDGEYTLEVWGAQGGTTNGGYGGYSKGTIYLKKNKKIYINVGGQGGDITTLTGGYNGGGAGSKGVVKSDGSSYPNGSGGGGATHISTSKGLLKELEQYQDSIYIVAGGGGGVCGNNWQGYSGGSGGGIEGNVGHNYPDTANSASGGQTKTGNQLFGKGTNAVTKNSSSCGAEGNGGGGGGYYGGFASSVRGKYSNASGPGGSGYIGNTILSNKVMYCYNCTESEDESTKTVTTDNHSETPTSKYAKEGNGYAKITLKRKIQDNSDFDFDYTGGEQTFTTPYTGIYKLEVWGAQGGAFYNSGIGGYGGYAVGNIRLTKNTSLYINVGEKGHEKGGKYVVRERTFNGGGASGDVQGGGATHIGYDSGLLSTYENKVDHLLIVAGGGAGGERHLGGSGGGYKGTSGAYGYNNAVATPATGGTQTEGGTGATLAGDYQTQYGDGSPGVFGLGANSCLSGVCGGGAGGGGYFGGGSTVYVGGGGGGSGYIGNNSLFDKKMYCYKCEETPENDIRTLSTNSTSAEPRVNQAKEGNGFSRITLLKRTINQTALTLDFAFEEYLNGNEYTFSYTGDYQTFTVPKTGYYKVELWGSGGNDKAGSGGEGGYTSGKIYLVKGEKLYVYVGRKNQNTSKFNASNYTKYAVYSSGSTDIRTVSGNWDDFDSLKTRIMVAGAGGMAGGTNSTVSHPGGAGGGLVSYAGINGGAGAVAGGKATQISGQSFGLGNLTYHEWGAPGANGYFAGGSGSGGNDQGSAGGGSSFISGHAGCVAVKESSVSDNLIFNDDSNGVSCDSTDSSTFNSNGYNTDINCSKHYSNRIFTDTKMIDGKGYEWTTEVGTEVVGMPTQDGTSTMKGNTGNGFAKITFLEEIPEYTFDYTGDVQTFIAPYNGIYKVELWGASGYDFDEKEGGKGAYTSGTITLSKNTPLYLYVGGNARYNAYNGIDGPTGKTGDPSIAKDYGAGGGGSTDVRVVKSTWDNFESLKSRIMVAAGGGGVGTRGGGYGKWNGGDAGGLIGYDGIGVYLTETSTEDTGGYCNGASQIAGGHCYITYSQNNYYGMFGRTNAGLRLTGGSGYYAGAGAFHVSGSGGSSYISGHSGCVSITKESTQDNITFVNASNGVACNDETSTGYNSLGYNTDYSCNKHYSGYTFTDTVMIDGKGYSWDENGVGSEVVGMPSHDGRSTMIGNTGNGYAKITLIEKIDTYNINYDLDGGTISKPKKSFSIFDEDFTLKTPTKEGYTFLGWIGGKNLYNSPTITKYTYSYSIPTHAYTGSGLEITTDTNSVKLLKKDDNSNWIGGLTNKIKLKKNTDYTLTMTIEGDASSSRIGVYNIENNEYVINQYIMNEMGNIEVHFTTDSTGYIVLLFGFGNTKTDKYFLFKNIQLEEGTEATSYEEYNNTRQKNLVITNGSQYNRTYKAVWRDDSVLCKKATTLNTRPCNALYEAGTKRCYAAGYEEGETITYGTLVDGDIKSGDAFDCDVNGDGIFDSENERFYYLTDLDSNNDYAVLLFSSYTKKGARHLTSANPIRYYTEDENWHGPITAIADLPSTEQWSNISLTNNSRQIYSENGNTTTSGGDLPIFAYTDKAARLPTYAEIFSACGQTSKIYQTCEYVLQDTSFDGMVTNGNFGFWLETPKEDTTDSAFRIDTHWMSVSASYPVTRNNMMVKPVIEVPKSKIK